MNEQLKKGILELLILNALNKSEMYGYNLYSVINEEVPINESTVYGVLKRCLDAGYLTSKMVKSDIGPSRKYFYITTKGMAQLLLLKREWQALSETVNLQLGGE